MNLRISFIISPNISLSDGIKCVLYSLLESNLSLGSTTFPSLSTKKDATPPSTSKSDNLKLLSTSIISSLLWIFILYLSDPQPLRSN